MFVLPYVDKKQRASDMGGLKNILICESLNNNNDDDDVQGR